MNGFSLAVVLASLGAPGDWERGQDGYDYYSIRIESRVLQEARATKQAVTQSVDREDRNQLRYFQIAVVGTDTASARRARSTSRLGEGVKYGWKPSEEDPQYVDFWIQVSTERMEQLARGLPIYGEIPVALSELVNNVLVFEGVEDLPQVMPTGAAGPAAPDLLGGNRRFGQQQTRPDSPTIEAEPPRGGRSDTPSPGLSGPTNRREPQYEQDRRRSGDSTWRSQESQRSGGNTVSDTRRSIGSYDQQLDERVSQERDAATYREPPPDWDTPRGRESSPYPRDRFAEYRDRGFDPQRTGRFEQDQGRNYPQSGASMPPPRTYGPPPSQTAGGYTHQPVSTASQPTWQSGATAHQAPPYQQQPQQQQVQPQVPPAAQLVQQTATQPATSPAAGVFATQVAAQPAAETVKEEVRPWGPLILTTMALFTSLGANAYLGWLAWSFFWRFKDVASDVVRARNQASAATRQAA